MSRRYGDSAFQSLELAMLNALLPATVDRVNGTHSRLCSRERMPLDGAYGTISSCKYRMLARCYVVDTDFHRKNTDSPREIVACLMSFCTQSLFD